MSPVFKYEKLGDTTLADHLTEEQQIETLKKFWKENGTSIILGIVIAIVITFGWRFYKAYRVQTEEHASVVYERVVQAADKHDFAMVKAQTQFLKTHYKRTPYSQLAVLTLAQQYIQQGKFNDAISQLNWVIQHGSTNTFQQLARIRLARIYVMQKQAEQALKVLKDIDSKAYLGIVWEVRGDAYLQLAQKDQAKEAYQNALQVLPESSDYRSLIQMKLNDI
ncbi:MAG: tetratricopeptide repeat protein [Gammaproteobacteria bacterium]|nr:tetratricopeptide repeat protein [Gammaproteobacteria bacterium]